MVIKPYSIISISRYARLLFLKLCLDINVFDIQQHKIIYCPWQGRGGFRYLNGRICCEFLPPVSIHRRQHIILHLEILGEVFRVIKSHFVGYFRHG